MVLTFISFVIVALCSGCWATPQPPAPPPALQLLKPAVCNNGQVYWCKNITTAAQCNAVKHCITNVWEHEVPIENDVSTICQTCKDMVKLARDQLLSNETQDEMRQVLEATCKVIPTKTLRDDCDKLMDDFGSYIVDTLASEMNPQIVCSVCGLCNSYLYEKSKLNKVQLNCENCFALMKGVENNIETASTNDLFTALAGICGQMGSFSDACSSLIHENLEKVDAFIRANVKADPVCSVAGVCKERYHNHGEQPLVRVPLGDVELIPKRQDNDLPCDLCVQLVKHLKDVLIANTTEEEFKMVVMGLCKMTPFKDDCDTIVNNYYEIVYTFLTSELNGTLICSQIGICPASGVSVVRPLLLVDEAKNKQLPVERLVPLTFVTPTSLGNVRTNPELCSFCEYFLHFIQMEMTLPSSEKEITDFAVKACNKLPVTVANQCDSFVLTYMPAFIALLANQIDPSQVCPNLGVCPSSLVAVEYKDKPTCPLCLLAVESILSKIPNKTALEVNDALDDLCIRDVFPNTLSTECVKFITDYRSQITDMIIAEFTAQETCVYAEICVIPKHPQFAPKHHSHELEEHNAISTGNVETNEIVQNVKNPNVCVLCEFVMTKLEQELKDKKTEEEIKDAVYKVCNYMPRTITAQCKNFIKQYADFVIDLISQEIAPKEICTALNLCGKANVLIRSPIKRCLMCELLMDGLKTVVTEPEVEDDINVQLLKACNHFPDDHVLFCRRMVEMMAPQFETALRSLPIGPLVCHRVHMCANHGTRAQLIKMAGTKGKCYVGPDYWCKSTTTAARCQQIEYCQKHVWRSDKPRKLIPKGSDLY